MHAKRVKRRKQFRGSMAGKAQRGNKIYGEYGIVARNLLDQIQPDRGKMPGHVTSNVAVVKFGLKFSDKNPGTSKPAETRMGSGKGAHWSLQLLSQVA